MALNVSLDEVSIALSHLGPAYDVIPIGPIHLVVGPTGAHLVAKDDGGTETARYLTKAAGRIRSALADHTIWVPYVHALLVSDSSNRAPATAVPLSLLALTIVDSPVTVTTAELERLRHVMAGARLADLDVPGFNSVTHLR